VLNGVVKLRLGEIVK